MKKNSVNKKQRIWKYGFAIGIIILGIILGVLKVGQGFLGFNSVGTWLIYVGFIMVVVTTLQKLSKKRRIVDERAEFVGMKASRITFVAIILFSFIIMIIDGIKAIQTPYSYFMGCLISGIILVYFISYKILERKY